MPRLWWQQMPVASVPTWMSLSIHALVMSGIWVLRYFRMARWMTALKASSSFSSSRHQQLGSRLWLMTRLARLRPSLRVLNHAWNLGSMERSRRGSTSTNTSCSHWPAPVPPRSPPRANSIIRVGSMEDRSARPAPPPLPSSPGWPMLLCCRQGCATPPWRGVLSTKAVLGLQRLQGQVCDEEGMMGCAQRRVLYSGAA